MDIASFEMYCVKPGSWRIEGYVVTRYGRSWTVDDIPGDFPTLAAAKEAIWREINGIEG